MPFFKISKFTWIVLFIERPLYSLGKKKNSTKWRKTILCFSIPKILKILMPFARSFHHTQTSYFWWVKGKTWTAFWCKSFWYRQPLSWKIHWIFLKESYIRTYIVKKCNIKSWKPCIFTKLDTYMQCPSDLFLYWLQKNRILLGFGIFRSRICCAFMNSTFKK